MRINDIIEDKGANVTTMDAQATLQEAIVVLENESIRSLIITSEQNPLAGILSERDIVRAVSKGGAGALRSPIRDFMTAKMVTVTRETTILEAMEIMTKNRIRHLPVVEEGQLCGIVSIGDVVKHRIQEAENEAEALIGYITSG